MANEKASYLRDNEKQFASQLASKRGLSGADTGDKGGKRDPKGNYADKEIKKGGK